MIGTIRKNKTTNPSVLLEVKGKAVFTSKFAFTKDTTFIHTFQKNICVVLQSTLHKTKELSGGSENKPNIILDYNATKGGVDTLDKMIANYSTRRKINR